MHLVRESEKDQEANVTEGTCSEPGGTWSETQRPGITWATFLLNAVWMIFRAECSIPWIVLIVKDFFLK